MASSIYSALQAPSLADGLVDLWRLLWLMASPLFGRLVRPGDAVHVSQRRPWLSSVDGPTRASVWLAALSPASTDQHTGYRAEDDRADICDLGRHQQRTNDRIWLVGALVSCICMVSCDYEVPRG